MSLYIYETDKIDMIGEKVSPLVFLEDYENSISPGFVPGIKYLASKYSIRKVRGDGNCFYRSFLFSYLEELLTLYNSNNINLKSLAENERIRVEALIIKSKDELITMGYSEIAIECFHDVFLDLLVNLFSYDIVRLLSLFQENGQSDYFTWFMRLLTAASIRRDAERFYPFIEDSVTGGATDLDTYLKREVEPMGKECEQVHVIALTEYLGVNTTIEYLDGKPFADGAGLTKMAFTGSPAATTEVRLSVCLLYRPGHYDILYTRHPNDSMYCLN